MPDDPQPDIYLEVLRALREQIFEMRARSAVQERILADLLSREIASDPEAVRALLADVRVNLMAARDDIDPHHGERVLRVFGSVTGAAERRALLKLAAGWEPQTDALSRLRAMFAGIAQLRTRARAAFSVRG